MRHAAVMVALLACGNASAQSVYKCIDRHGATSYQSAPCDHADRTARQWDAPPDPPPSAEQLRARAAQREHDRAESDYLSRRAGTYGNTAARASGTTVRTPSRGNACEAAKAHRERTLAAVGLKRTFDLLRKLDDAVYDACK